MNKKIIITADDLGKDINSNEAILDSFKNGILTSSCIMTNMPGFIDALEKINQNECMNDIGIHLNVIEGNSLVFNYKSTLTDENGAFNNGFIKLLLKSFDDKFMQELEKEFTAQIEKAIENNINIIYLNSHVHTHSIPNIFKLCIKLCEKYNIKYIRTQQEIPYFVPNLKRHLNMDYFINIIKNILLNIFTYINKAYLKKHNIKTNNNFVGVLYTANMDKSSILFGIKKVKGNCEIILHPTTDENKKLNNIEYKSLIDDSLKQELVNQNVKLIAWKDLN